MDGMNKERENAKESHYWGIEWTATTEEREEECNEKEDK
jgi:hypothetical protein